MNLLLAAALVLSPLPAQDTVVSLARGGEVRLENLSGEVVVRAWDRDEVQVTDRDRGSSGLRVRPSDGGVRIETEGRRKDRHNVDIEVRVPSWANVHISGRTLDVGIAGIRGDVVVTNVRGDIRTQDTEGELRLRSQQGEIEVSDASGEIVVSAQSDDVWLSGIRGEVEVRSTSGDITLLDVSARVVRAETQDGDIEFSGELLERGRYAFFVHDGDVELALPESASAVVSASTFDVEFESDFPVRLQRYRGGQKFDFTLGEGSAQLELHVFDGEIRLVRQAGD